MDTLAAELQRQPKAGYELSPAMVRILARLPEGMSTSFNTEQLAALNAALDLENPTRHPLDLRVTLFGRAFIAIIGGREQRTPARRIVERGRHPLSSAGNIAFLIGVAIIGLILGNTLRMLLLGG